MNRSLLSIKTIALSALLVFSLSCEPKLIVPDNSDDEFESINVGSSQSITFTFSDSSITASKSSDTYNIDGTNLTVKASGSYKVNGNCSNGSITIQKGTTDVNLTFDSITLSCDYTAPLFCGKESNVTLYLNGNSTLTDKEDPADEDSSDSAKADAFEGACIKAKSNSVLTIKGEGTLNVDASNCKNGIIGLTEVAINIESGTVNVKAANKGISSRGSLNITGGNVNVQAVKGIESDPDYELDDVARKTASFVGGTVTISGGTITVRAEDEAIKAASRLEIGIKGNPSGPKIDVTKSENGIAAAQVFLYSGNGTIISNNDGIKAAYKRFTNTDESDAGYQYANDLYSAFKEKYGDFLMEFDGGSWFVDAAGDGLDSDGEIMMNGGNLTVFGSEGNDDAAVDYETVFEINDGQILAIGTVNMAVYPTRTPEGKSYVAFGDRGQIDPVVYPVNPDYMVPPSIKKGDKIVVKDSENNIVASTTAVKNANWVMFALTDEDKSYLLYINDVECRESENSGEHLAR